MGSLRKKKFTKPLPACAELFEKNGKQFAKWIDGNGKKRTAHTTSGRDGSTRIRIESSFWLAKYRDGSGVVQEVSTHCKDRAAAQTMLTELERRAEKIRSGILQPSEERIASHSAKPIAQHFKAYHDDRVSRELNATRIKNTNSRLKRLAEECGFRRLTDLAGEPLAQWLGLQLERDMGPGTRNEYRKELVGFANWCIKTQRLTSNPFAHIPIANVKADQRRKRRAMPEDDFERLLHVTRLRPLAEYGRKTVHLEVHGDSPKRSNWTKAPITYDTLEATVANARQRLARNPQFAAKLDQQGRERALIHRMLLLTGLRCGELASLRIGWLELDAPTPFVVLEAGDEKNGKGKEVPLRADLVVELRKWIEEKREKFTGEPEAFMQQPLFFVPTSLLRAFDSDLAVAGISKKDHRGRTVDLHGMRMTLATMLNKSGVAPRTAQEILRHSDIRLTMETYTDAKLLNVSGALDQLPRFSPDRPPEKPSEAMRATGTAGALPLTGALPGLSESLPVILTAEATSRNASRDSDRNPTKPTKKGLSEGNSDKPSESGRQDLNLRPLHPQCFGCTCRIAVNLLISVRCRTRGFSTRYTDRHELHIE
jgi:integrase